MFSGFLGVFLLFYFFCAWIRSYLDLQAARAEKRFIQQVCSIRCSDDQNVVQNIHTVDLG
jgi:hypothetical protein